MIDHVWTVVCSRAVIDKESNNVSLQNVLEQLVVSKKAQSDAGELEIDTSSKFVLPYRFMVISLWSRSDLKEGVIGYGRVKLYSPDNELLIEPKIFEINLHNFRRFRSRGVFPGFPIQGPGKYTFSVEFRIDEETQWKEVSRVPIEVRFEDDEESE